MRGVSRREGFGGILVLAASLVAVPGAAGAVPDPGGAGAPDVRWTRQFGDWMDDWAADVVVDERGDSYVVGTFNIGGTVQFDAFVRSYDRDGALRWIRWYHPEVDDSAIGVAVGEGDGIYVVGDTVDDDWVNSEAYLRAYARDGSVRWTRRFGSGADDQPTDVAVDRDGNVYVVGWTRGALEGGAHLGWYDAFVRSWDAGGRLRWTRQFGTAVGDQAEGVAVDRDGDILVVGHTRGALSGAASAGRDDAFVRSYSPGGTLRWTLQFGTPRADEAVGVAVAPDGSFCVVGSTGGVLPGPGTRGQGGAFVRCYEDRAALRWTRQGVGNPTSIAVTDAGVVVTAGDIWDGGTRAAPGPGQSIGETAAFVRAYGPDGALRWTHRFGGRGIDSAGGVAAGPDGAIAVAGQTQRALPGQEWAGGRDAFIRMYQE